MLTNLRLDTRRLREIKSKPFPWFVLESLLFENGYQAVVFHRVAHWFKVRRVPVIGPLVARCSLLLTGVDIAPGAVIGPGLRISHGMGIVIGDRARIGGGALLMHDVTLGAPSQGRIGEMPVLGERVTVGAGARIIGRVTIGDDVLIPVNAVVTRDVPAGARVVWKGELAIEPAEGDGGQR
jgi:serine O-acetyltransferase